MDAPPAESRTFLHRVVRCVAVLALAYGLLQAVTLTAWGITRGLPYDGYYVGSRHLAVGMSLLAFALTAFVIVGGWGLLKWKAWGRVALIVWSALTIVLGCVQSVLSDIMVLRSMAATTQPGVQPHAGVYVWTSFHHWLTYSALPIVILLAMLQPEVARLWSGPRGAGGFEVIPMASTAAANPQPEVVQ